LRVRLPWCYQAACAVSPDRFSGSCRAASTARAEDRNDAEIAEGAGEIGFFSPGSYWPIAIALAATVAGFGMVLAQFWLLALGVVLVLFTAGGLLFEYYAGRHAPLS
jgi:hypothetical protein